MYIFFYNEGVVDIDHQLHRGAVSFLIQTFVTCVSVRSKEAKGSKKYEEVEISRSGRNLPINSFIFHCCTKRVVKLKGYCQYHIVPIYPFMRLPRLLSFNTLNFFFCNKFLSSVLWYVKTDVRLYPYWQYIKCSINCKKITKVSLFFWWQKKMNLIIVVQWKLLYKTK